MNTTGGHPGDGDAQDDAARYRKALEVIRALAEHPILSAGDKLLAIGAATRRALFESPTPPTESES